MSRYRKTMAQAMNESAINMQIAALKRAYEPMRNKRISLDNANKLSQIFNRFDANKEMMKQLYKADIPFVSAMASSRLISKHNMKAQELMQIRKEGIETATEELQQINEIFLGEGVGHISGFRNDKEKANVISLAKQHGLKVDDSGSKLKISGNMRKILDIQLAVQKNGLKAEEVRISLDEGKMKTIATMFNQGKSAEEIAKKMKLPVDTVKSILGEVKESADTRELTNLYNKRGPLTPAEQKRKAELEKKLGVNEELHEFKKMTVTIRDMDKRKKAIADLMKQNLGVSVTGGVIKVDGKGRDLNNIAKDLMNFYSANVRAESYTIDESADEDFYNPVTEACWTGYKQVGMKDKGGKKVPNCVPESVNEQDDSMTMAKDMKKKKEELPKSDDVAATADTEKKEKKESESVEKLKKEVEKKDDEIAMLKTKAETEKAKVAKKETEKMVNPETGEPLLQVGVAYKHLRDKMAKMKEDVDYLKPKLNSSQIANIKKTWQDKKPGDVTPAVKNMIKNMDIPTQLAIKHANIKFLSKLVEDLGKEDEPKVKQIIKKLKGASQAHAGQAKDLEKVMKTEADLTKSQIKKVHDKADELPKKDFRDRYGKEKGDSVRYGVATKMIKKKLNIENKNHPGKELYETIKGLKNKAEKSGMPYSILKKVYDRGMAAWRGGHRPGASQQQWAFARVNSFITKSSGTWGGADKDLAKQVRGSK